MIKNIKQFLFIAALLIIAAGAQPAQTAFWQWSTTPANNATADPNINWSEGMSPSSVNDSARAMMSVLANWRKDVSGTILSGGSTSAITITTNTGYPNLAALDGQMISFLHNFSGNTAGATLNIDGTGPIVIKTGTTPIPTDSLMAGGFYSVVYYASDNSYRIHGTFNSANSVPLGGIIFTTMSTAPNANFLSANGQCISQTTYSVFYAAIGSPGQGACASGQFPLIDLRGRVIAGLDILPGSVAANRMTASPNGCGSSFTTMGVFCASGAEAHILSAAQIPTITSSGSMSGSSSGSISGATSTVTLSGFCSNCGVGGGGSFGPAGSASVSGSYSGSASVSGSVTSNNTGGGASSAVQPTVGFYPWVRVL